MSGLRLRIENFKRWRELDVELGKVTVIVGPNGSGKSSVVDMLTRIAQYSAPFAQWRNDGPRMLEQLNDHYPWREEARTPGHVIVGRLAADGWTRELRVHVGAPSLTQVAFGRRGPGGIDDWVESPNRDGPALPPGLKSVHPEDRGSEGPFLTVGRAPHDVMALARPTPLDEPRGVGGWSAAHVATAIHQWRASDPGRMESLVRDVAQVMPAVRQILTPISRQRRQRRILVDIDGTFEERTVMDESPVVGLSVVFADGRTLPASVLSTGTLRVISALASLHGLQPSDRAKSVLLFDDIEADVHPRAQDALMRTLIAAAQARDDLHVVATTHSPFIVDAVSLEDVRVTDVNAMGESVMAGLGDHRHWAEWSKTLLPGEFWTWAGESWVGRGERS